MTPTGEAEIFVESYDETWPEQFESERELLSSVIGNYVQGGIEHIGSTAVPNLAAKPVIDIIVGVESLAASRPALALLDGLQYCYSAYRPDVMHWLCKPSFEFRTQHLHLIPFQSTLWIERITFRNYLREHSDVAAKYAELKHRLAEKHRLDRESYTDSKAPFIRRTLECARAS